MERLRETEIFNDPKLRRNIEVRSEVNLETRLYFHNKGYIETETPILTPDPEVAPVKPFVIENPECYLRITDTEFLKRLMYAGFGKIFQLAKDFREGDSNYKSNPEFTQLSIAARGIDYEQMVGVFKDYMSSVAKKVNDTPVISFFGSRINLETDWSEITVKDALAKFCDIDLDKNLENSDLEKTMERLKVPVPSEAKNYYGVIKYNIMMESILDKFIMPEYKGKILFLKEYPYGLNAPGKAVEDKPQYKQRGEVFVNGIEIINGSTIPTNPDFIKSWYDHALKAQLDSGLWPGKRLDEDYLRSTRLGIPHMSAMTLGYDRYIMMLTNSKNISEVITFPIILKSK
ncbi:MAG: amino acid--tRNA ligase-related protein [Patescibacteria group bacterium]